MPYTSPTAGQFKAKFPTFASVADDAIQAALAEAQASVSPDWIEADYQPALMYLAAHTLVIDGVSLASSSMDAGTAGVIASGQVSEMKVGDVMVKMAGGGQGMGAGGVSGLSATRFGQRYLELLRRNQPAVALV